MFELCGLLVLVFIFILFLFLIKIINKIKVLFISQQFKNLLTVLLKTC